MNNEMLSILTNFGCHFGCSYCVYRENGINIPKTNINTFGWNELEEELKKRKGETISISGGGDPLYSYEWLSGTAKYYNKLFDLLAEYDCGLELHTSILNEDFPYELCERVVFHLNMPTQIDGLRHLYNVTDSLRHCGNIRVVFVVQEHYSKHLIQEIVKNIKVNGFITELSFRQMIDKNGQATNYLYDYLKEGHQKDWYYIEQADYNKYFVQNHIECEYLKIK